MTLAYIDEHYPDWRDRDKTELPDLINAHRGDEQCIELEHLPDLFVFRRAPNARHPTRKPRPSRGNRSDRR